MASASSDCENRSEFVDEDLSTSSIDTSDDEEDYIDVENGEIDKSWALERKSKESFSSRFGKGMRNKKNYHNAHERMRREQLKSCFVALKKAINRPDVSNNDALKYMAVAISELHKKKRIVEERLKEMEKTKKLALEQSDKDQNELWK